MAAKNRNEISPEFQWDFTHIYKDDAAWEEAYNASNACIDKIAQCPGTLGTSAEALANALDIISKAEESSNTVYIYAMLRLCCDNGDPAYQEMQAKAETLVVRLSTLCAFLDPEILSIPEDTLNEYMKDPRLATYRHRIDNIQRARNHTLSADQEKMLAMLGDVSGNPQNTFTMFESVDMEFPDLIAKDGTHIPLTHGAYGVYRADKDRDMRKQCFEKYYGAFQKYNNTLASTYTGCVKFDTFYAKARKFDSACEAALFTSNVPTQVYDKLIEAIHGGLPALHRYNALRQKLLGLSDFHTYDMSAPIIENIEMEVPYEDAKQMVKNATRPLGEDYQKRLDRAFSENWIDVYENKGKTTGAFSCGLYGVHPYILLNYAGKLDDAFTLAHELGHCMHSCYSSEAQDFQNHDYQIFVAEVASTVNEVLMTKYLLSVEKDPHRRAYILNHFLEGFRGTVFAQALFAEFEYEAHKMYQETGALTAQGLNGIFRNLNDQYYKGMERDELLDCGWSRVPHFYNAFYVYQYSTGFCSAIAIANNILKTGDASNYLKFLSTGGSDYPINELKIAGVDLTKPDTVANALNVFAESLAEFEELMENL